MATNLFATAKVVEAPVKSKKKDDKVEIQIDGLEDYAVLTDLIKNLTTIQATLAEDVKGKMREIFAKSTSRPENFRGVDGNASASCEMRKRSTASPLADGEVEVLMKNHVPFGENVLVEERFVINTKYTGDQELLKKISDALSKVKGLPEDFILLQKGSATKVVTDETVEKVFELGLGESLIDTVAVLAIKPKVEKVDVKAALDRAKKLVL
jgi:hypothetical protein